ncbi:MAG TPA: NAD-binding protein [Nocardioidaceae bacterium]|nr:NAD-binding protein [Nocardioidaceae bacterium]
MARSRLPELGPHLSSAGVFLVLRRMRAPLIVLIVIFAVSVLGLSLVPGVDDEGRPDRMSLFDAFYFMAYTATTIGFGELPHEFTAAQRMWVTLSIFLAVVGWAYAIGSLLSLMQDPGFRQALARRSFTRAVRRISEPYLLLVGYGNASKILARSLDDMGRRFVVIDSQSTRVSSVELDAYRADAPALLGDARDTGLLTLAGLGHRACAGVIALAGDDETNLDVAITTALLRPELPVIARSSSRAVAERMRAFHVQDVVNPLDRFGDHLRILLRSPAAYQLMIWLTSSPGTPLPERFPSLPHGRWVVCGHGRYGDELSADLRAEGLDVTVVHVAGGRVLAGEGDSAHVVESGHVAEAVAFVAATASDTTNLWLVEAARRANPDAFVVALQNRRANAPLFAAVGVDFGMVPAEVIAHEVLARLANPVLMRFLPQVPRQADGWAERLVERLVATCGDGTPDLWRIRLDAAEAPALTHRLAGAGLRLEDLLRDPADRDTALDIVPLTLLRQDERTITPTGDVQLRPEDQLLLAGRLRARAALDTTMTEEPTASYVLDGRRAAASWVWRRFSRQDPAGEPR